MKGLYKVYLTTLIIFQQAATYSVYYTSVCSSTCLDTPSSGARTTVNTASGID